MSHIMNHREIEYFTENYWKINGIAPARYQLMLSESKQAMEIMDWLEDTYNRVTQPDLVMDYGIDCIRCYLLFEKTPQEKDPYFESWDEGALEGVYKFISKYRRMIQVALEANTKGIYETENFEELFELSYQMECEVIQYLEKNNTLANRHSAISVLMEGFKKIQKRLKINELSVREHENEIEAAIPLSVKKEDNALKCDHSVLKENRDIFSLCKVLVQLAAPFIPYISEELWQQIAIYERHETDQLKKWYQLQCTDSVCNQIWSVHEIDNKSICKKIDIPVQINAKTKIVLHVPENITKEKLLQLAQNELSHALQDMGKYRVVFVEGKLINFVR